MKKLLVITILILFNFFFKSSSAINNRNDPFAGKWYGELIVSPKYKLKVAFEITKLASGEYDAIMHSIDQKSYNLTVDRIYAKTDSISMQIKMMGAIYSGKAYNDTTIIGELSLSKGKGKRLDMVRCNEFPFPIAKRPQEPRKPYPYISEDVRFSNTTEGIVLSGTLTKPFASKKAPAVILISGSGPSDRNQTILGHKTFLVLADYLTRNGFAVLRYDDRGAGESEGIFMKATVLDHALDASFAIDYLKSRSDIDHERIGIIGHSLGGVIAPIVATLNKNVSFLVLMAGGAIPLKDVIVEQCEAILPTLGISAEGISLNRKILETTMETYRKSTNDSLAKVEIKSNLASFDSQVTNLSKNDIEKLELSVPLKISDYSKLLLPFMRYDLFHNPSEIFKKVNCPVFAINGDKDLQVLPYNLKLIEKSLITGGNRKITTKLYQGKNHLFQNCTTGTPEECPEIDETISEDVIKDIISWIKKNN